MANCRGMDWGPILGAVLLLMQPAASGRGKAVKAYLDGKPPQGTPVADQAYNQGPPARLRLRDGAGEVWMRQVGERRWVVALLNPGETPVSLNVGFRTLELPYHLEVQDLWPGERWGVVEAGFAQRVDPGDARVFLLSARR